jgi:hypothetical protein
MTYSVVGLSSAFGVMSDVLAVITSTVWVEYSVITRRMNVPGPVLCDSDGVGFGNVSDGFDVIIGRE